MENKIEELREKMCKIIETIQVLPIDLTSELTNAVACAIHK